MSKRGTKALVVGVGKDLPGTVLDATSLADALVAADVAERDDIAVLTGPDATGPRIVAGLSTLLAAEPLSTAVLFFSGHGAPTPDFHLVPYDYVASDPRTGVSEAVLSDAIRQSPAARVVVMLDCCFAGGQAHPKGADGGLSALGKRLTEEGRGRVVLAASTRNQVAYATERHSYFTRALIEGLGGGADLSEPGSIGILDLALWTHHRVRELSGGAQTPIVHVADLSENFAFARATAAASASLDKTTVAAVANPLAAIPHGPLVEQRYITDALVDAYAELFPSRQEMQAALRRAQRLILEHEPEHTYPRAGDLPEPSQGAAAYWHELFSASCRHGPKMVAALLQLVPSVTLLPDRAAADRNRLLHALTNRRTR